MKVHELIRKLQELPLDVQETSVFWFDGDYQEYVEIDGVIQHVRPESDSDVWFVELT